jgi:hypothetical protein
MDSGEVAVLRPSELLEILADGRSQQVDRRLVHVSGSS